MTPEQDRGYMARALQLARCGYLDTAPNPMVGAVIVADGRIIGEGYHRRYGEGHAEVNAIASVKERHLLREASMYVTLEPCAHYGKTPPCAKLIIDTGIPRVVVGCVDPFSKVGGKGIAMLREAGVEVVTGVMERECRNLNPKFMTAHTHQRPFITLKWAQSADGYLDHRRLADGQPAIFSSPLTQALVHKLRAEHQAIMVGSETVLVDHPQLSVRAFAGRSPQRITVDRRGRCQLDDSWTVYRHGDIRKIVEEMYQQGVTSLLVEGGTALLEAFLHEGLWDKVRVEIAPFDLGSDGGVKAPSFPAGRLVSMQEIDGRQILNFSPFF
ncbi:MAG: bifunctional diaminohydroxyphosphoribosylaminopyrimidine deaminase/5-amino-6-(5-phosphoribosylamino)uracil reductase RibD [Bacteroidales bacterium]|nr:bifunctional diaminohydroxyphosphoribosylaminopyrimidine deaminase/5-amino-6-(5-phosphoribosylamino)uracil reductase RibD [Bacteroidales bacterium]